MFNLIRWKAFLRVSSSKKADTVLRRLAEAMGEDVANLDAKPYWKDPALYEASFTTRLKAKRIEDAVFHALRVAGRIAHHWNVSAPQDHAGGKWDFAGMSEKRPIVPGVDLVMFEVNNHE